MGELVALPKTGDVFEDVRGGDRTMRVTCHPQRGTVVVSLWVDRICRASFQLAEADLPRLQEALAGMRFEAPLEEPFDNARPGPEALPETA
ncbi:hypothetical protein [Dactylosporangium sp. NPDC051484]|uniref:hypothetical protein n=1 Tax=Dactylosporangium sp. NPDC051484 TaxID=3154942 RepID=UPI00344CED00